MQTPYVETLPHLRQYNALDLDGHGLSRRSLTRRPLVQSCRLPQQRSAPLVVKAGLFDSAAAERCVISLPVHHISKA